MKIFTDVDDTILDLSGRCVQLAMRELSREIPNWVELCRWRKIYKFEDLSDSHELSFMKDIAKKYYGDPNFYSKYSIQLIRTPIIELLDNPKSEVTFGSVTLPQNVESKRQWLKYMFPDLPEINFLVFSSTRDKIDYLKENVSTYDFFCDDQLGILQEAGIPAEKSISLNRGYINPVGGEIIYEVVC